MTRSTLGWIALALGLAGCTSPKHLTYDFGRAYMASVIVQTDLTRPSVAAGGYPLDGREAEQIRLNVAESTTDAESGQDTLGQ